MAEFSKEYIEAIGLHASPDFSYLEEFKKSKSEITVSLICEGLGAIGFINKNNICYLLFQNEEVIELNTFTNQLKGRKDV